MAVKKTAAKKSSAKKAPVKKAAKKAPAKKAATKKEAKPSGSAQTDNYTKPALREKIKKQVMAGSKGGRAGQWSARKAQLVTHAYEAQGGGYKRKRNAAQRSLKDWGKERWHTADGKQAVQGKKTSRYLPDAAWKELSPQQRKATDRKKTAASRRGKQYVANTPAAAKARKRATRDSS